MGRERYIETTDLMKKLEAYLEEPDYTLGSWREIHIVVFKVSIFNHQFLMK